MQKLTYPQWIDVIDGILLHRSDEKFDQSFDQSLLADWPSWDTYDEGKTPYEALSVIAEYQDDLFRPAIEGLIRMNHT